MKLIISLFVLFSFWSALTKATTLQFPDDFKFGVATAAYQIEGGWNEDGKGENIWDNICHTNPYYVYEKQNGDVACDSYHKWETDIANIKALGVKYYRFSLSWSRILPTGDKKNINSKGIDYYRNLIKALLAEDITPVVTIFHWDTPLQLHNDFNSFTNEQIVQAYVDYATVVFDNFGDLVKLWITFNEPKQTCHEGYGTSNKAPGVASSGQLEYQCAYYLLKAHAEAWHLYDNTYREKQGGKVGITIDTAWYEPANATNEQDQEAAERTLQFMFGQYANPIFNKNFPQVMIDRIKERSLKEGYTTSRLPQFTEEELKQITGTYDFLGLNFYTSNLVTWTEDAAIGGISFNNDLSVQLSVDPSWADSASDWLKITPWGLRKLLKWVKNKLNNPEIIITENGVSENGTLDDQIRIDYYREHLEQLYYAITEDNVNVKGYIAWSLMDNFEWRRGYSEKFGFYHVDFEDPERPRTPKASVSWFTDVVACRCIDTSSAQNLVPVHIGIGLIFVLISIFL